MKKYIKTFVRIFLQQNKLKKKSLSNIQNNKSVYNRTEYFQLQILYSMQLKHSELVFFEQFFYFFNRNLLNFAKKQ